MEIFGNLDFTNNFAQRMAFEMETSFPTTPVIGRICFVRKRLYICVEIVSGSPAWIPLTNEINTYLHNQTTASATWSIAHNLNTTTPLVQIYDTNQNMVTPSEVTIVDNNNITVTIGTSIVGRAVVMFGNISGLQTSPYAYTHTQTSLSATWVIPHNLGYYPVVRVFLNTGAEIQPLTTVHNSLFQVTITFSMPYVGTARLV